MQRFLPQQYKFFAVILTLLFALNASAYHLDGVRWTSGAFNYYINPIGVDNSVDYSSHSSTIIAAANEWENVSTTNIQLNYVGTSTDTEWGDQNGDNVITWKTDGWTGNVIGLSTKWYGGGEILTSDIKLNTAFAGDSRLPLLVTHEVGHSLGIDHTRESGESYTTEEYEAVMYYLLHSQDGFTKEDKCAITAIYPSSTSCEPTFSAGYHACIPCCSDDGSVTVNITNNEYTYDGTAQTVTVTTSPSGLAHTVSYFDQSGNSVASPTNAAIYDVTVTITETGYESEGPFYGTLTINERNLSITADNQQVDYGDNEPAYTITYSGFASGEDATDLSAQPSADINESWPAEPGTYTIYVSGASADNYNISYTNGTLTVNGLSVNDVSVSNYNHTYDGTSKAVTIITDPEGIGHTVAYSLNGNTVASPTNAATYDILITIDETGYNPDQFASTMEIAKADLTAQADDQTVLLGDPEPSYTISYNGFENGESEIVLDEAPTAGINETWPVAGGSYDIIVSGGSDNNYNIVQQNGTLTVVAEEADSVTFENLSYTYDGATHMATITTYPGGLQHETVYFDQADNEVTSPQTAGVYDIEVTITEPGYVQEVFTSQLTIDQEELFIVVNDTTVVYGSNEPNYSLALSGFIAGEQTSDLESLPTATLLETWPVLPGSYSINLSGGADDNYFFNLTSGSLTVTEAEADTVEFNNLLFSYNGNANDPGIVYNPDTIDYSTVFYDSLGNVLVELVDAGTYVLEAIVTEEGFVTDTFRQNLTIEKAEITATVSDTIIEYGDSQPEYETTFNGFVNNENTALIDTLPTPFVEGDWPLLPGTYTIEWTNGYDNNYEISTQTGILTVESSGVIVDIKDTVQSYTGQQLEATITTIPPDIDISVEYFDSEQNVITAPILAGNYSVQVTVTETGFEPIVTTSDFIVEKADLAVTMNSYEMNYGESLPDMDYQLSGFVNGEDENVLTQLPVILFEEEGALLPGNYPISVGEGEAANYNFNYTDGTLTILALEAETINISNTTTTYNGIAQSINVNTTPENLSYEVIYTNNGGNETTAPVNAGNYEYNVSINETGYAPSVSTGSFTIQKAMLAVKADTSFITYGEDAPVANIDIQGFINNESTSQLEENPGADTIQNWPWDVGEYELSISGGVAQNYSFEYDSWVIVVEPAVLTVQPEDQTIGFNNPLPDFNYTLSGFVLNEDELALDAIPVAFIEEEEQPEPGNYTIYASGGQAVNYTFEYLTGNLYVEPIADATITLENLETTYTGEQYEISASTSPEGLEYTIQYSDDPVNAGTYEAVATLNETGYLSVTDTAEIIINKATLTVAVADTSMLMGDDQPAFRLVFEGWVNTETIDVIDELPIAEIEDELPLNAGTYSIVTSGGSDNNYSFTYEHGELTVIQTYQVKVYAGEYGKVAFGETEEPADSIWERIVESENSSQFYAIPDENYQFESWDNGSTDNPISFEQVSSNIEITAQFSTIVSADEVHNAISAYPNPVDVHSPITVAVDMSASNYKNAQLKIIDQSGRIVYKSNKVNRKNNIGHLRQGIYTISVVSGQQVYVNQKLLVK